MKELPWTPVLVVERESGQEGVFRDRDESAYYLALVTDEGAFGSHIRGYSPAVGSLLEGETVVGGLLPTDAEVAEVRDVAGERHLAEVGDGAWLLLLPRSTPLGTEPAVVFRDAEGRVVPRPQAPGLRRGSMPDATDPCPACGGAEWEVVRHGSKGGWGVENDAFDFAVCAKCGHETRVGSFSWVADESDHALEWPDPEPVIEVDDLIRGAPFPIFGLPPNFPGRRWRAGCAYWPDRVTEVGLGHGQQDERKGGSRLIIRSSSGDGVPTPDEERARAALRDLIAHTEPRSWPDSSEAAIDLWLTERRREQTERAWLATLTQIEIRVDETSVRFAHVREGRAWAAAGERGGVSITITALQHEPEDVELATVSDIERYLDTA